MRLPGLLLTQQSTLLLVGSAVLLVSGLGAAWWWAQKSSGAPAQVSDVCLPADGPPKPTEEVAVPSTGSAISADGEVAGLDSVANMAPAVAEGSVEQSGEKLDEGVISPAAPLPTLVVTEPDALPTSLPALGDAEQPEAVATPPHAESAPCGADSPPPPESQLAVPAADESEQLRLRMRGRALQELLSTEVSYLLHLHRLANLFVLPLRGDLPQTGCVDISQSRPAACASPSSPRRTGIHAALPLPDPLVLPPRLAGSAPANTVAGVGATPLGSPGGRRNSTSSVASTESGGAEAVPPSLLSVEQVGRLLTPFEHSRIFGGVDGLIPLHTTLLQELAAALRAGRLLATPPGDGFHAADACPRAAAAETCETPPAHEPALAEGSAAESLSSPAPPLALVPSPDEVCVGAVFLRLCPFLRMYSRYAEGQGAAGAEVRARMTHTRLPLMGAGGSGAGAGGGGGSGADEASDDACERDAQYASQVWNLAAALRLQACVSPRPSPGVGSVAPINCATPVAGGLLSPAAAPRSRFSLGFGAASRESRDSGGAEEEREREKAAAAGAKQQRRQLAAVRAVPVSFPRFVRVMESDPAAKGQSLASLLAMPIQRVPRYALLLKGALRLRFCGSEGGDPWLLRSPLHCVSANA
jgi:hypothetical protein